MEELRVPGETLDIRLEVLGALQRGEVRSRAHRWEESDSPRTFRKIEIPERLPDGTTIIPGHFWQRSHAWDGEQPLSYIAAATKADWRLLSFETVFQVDGGDLSASDLWGTRRTGRGRRSWYWCRVATGIEIENDWVVRFVQALRVGSEVSMKPRDGGYRREDAERVELGIAFVRDAKAKSAREAATIVSVGARGASPEAIVDRLSRKISRGLKAAQN